MNNPLVSVIIPAYNMEKYIMVGLKACICQTYNNIEIIVVDDGSEDLTADVVERLVAKDKRVVLIKQKNAGVSSARNSALNSAHGQFVIFLDADDWLEKDAIEVLVKTQNKFNRSFILCSRYIVNENNLTQKICYDKRISIERIGRDHILCRFLDSNLCFQSSCYKLFSMDLIDKYNLRFSDEISHGEDGLFIFEYLQHVESIISIPNPLWNILDRRDSASSSPFSEKKVSAISAIEKMLEYNVDEKAKAMLKKYFILRGETVLIDAINGGSIKNRRSIYYIRKKLRTKKEILFFDDYTKKEKIRYIALSFLPISIIRHLCKNN